LQEDKMLKVLSSFLICQKAGGEHTWHVTCVYLSLLTSLSCSMFNSAILAALYQYHCCC
jgi:hypothetical protein